MSKRALPATKERFIEDMASLLMPWGMAQTTARLYGYLLLATAPASLDEIAADLHMSKSSACVAAKLLERHRMIRRHAARGSKRVFYGPTDDHAALLSEQSAALGVMGRFLQRNAPASGAAGARLRDMAKFYVDMQGAIDASIARLSARVVSG